MLLIGICGPSAGGKTRLAGVFENMLGKDRCLILSQDGYYLDHPDLTPEERTKINYDEPGVFDHNLLLDDIRTLLKGLPITRKAYDYDNHRRCDPGEWIEPRQVVILEGIHSFHDERLRELMYLKLYTSVDPDICLLRRIRRDMRERGRSIESITEQYLATVKPMYERYIRYYDRYADMIVPGDRPFEPVVEACVSHIEKALQQQADQA